MAQSNKILHSLSLTKALTRDLATQGLTKGITLLRKVTGYPEQQQLTARSATKNQPPAQPLFVDPQDHAADLMAIYNLAGNPEKTITLLGELATSGVALQLTHYARGWSALIALKDFNSAIRLYQQMQAAGVGPLSPLEVRINSWLDHQVTLAIPQQVKTEPLPQHLSQVTAVLLNQQNSPRAQRFTAKKIPVPKTLLSRLLQLQ